MPYMRSPKEWTIIGVKIRPTAAFPNRLTTRRAEPAASFLGVVTVAGNVLALAPSLPAFFFVQSAP